LGNWVNKAEGSAAFNLHYSGDWKWLCRVAFWLSLSQTSSCHTRVFKGKWAWRIYLQCS